MKHCPTCKQELPLDHFFKNKSKKDGLSVQCKACHMAYTAVHKKKNKDRNNELARTRRQERGEELKAKKRAYRKANKDRENARQQEWRKANSDKANVYYLRRKDAVQEWRREHYPNFKDDPKFVLCNRMRSRINSFLKKDGKSWKNLVGYTEKELISRLKKTIPDGYTWDDLISGVLHIDHIIPIAAFNFETADDIDFKRCWALNNLQLLPAQDNIRKSDNLDRPFQPSLALSA